MTVADCGVVSPHSRSGWRRCSRQPRPLFVGMDAMRTGGAPASHDCPDVAAGCCLWFSSKHAARSSQGHGWGYGHQRPWGCGGGRTRALTGGLCCVCWCAPTLQSVSQGWVAEWPLGRVPRCVCLRVGAERTGGQGTSQRAPAAQGMVPVCYRPDHVPGTRLAPQAWWLHPPVITSMEVPLPLPFVAGTV